MKTERGFTLVELMVVVAMIAIMMASMGLAVAKAQQRARISRATQEVRELTNAILAFEQYARGRSLAGYTTGGWTQCSAGTLKIVLGGTTGESGEQVPVLFDAGLKGERFRDPWGTVYEYMIAQNGDIGGDGQQSGVGAARFMTSMALPNFFRLSRKERMRDDRGQ